MCPYHFAHTGYMKFATTRIGAVQAGKAAGPPGKRSKPAVQAVGRVLPGPLSVVDPSLESSARQEGYDPTCLNWSRLSGFRIAARTSAFLSQSEDPKSGKAHVFSICKRVTNDFKEGINHFLRFSPVQPDPAAYNGGEIGFGCGRFPDAAGRRTTWPVRPANGSGSCGRRRKLQDLHGHL